MSSRRSASDRAGSVRRGAQARCRSVRPGPARRTPPHRHPRGVDGAEHAILEPGHPPRHAGLEQFDDLPRRPGVGFGEGAFTDLLPQRFLHPPASRVVVTLTLWSLVTRPFEERIALRLSTTGILSNENAGGFRIRKLPAFG